MSVSTPHGRPIPEADIRHGEVDLSAGTVGRPETRCLTSATKPETDTWCVEIVLMPH